MIALNARPLALLALLALLLGGPPRAAGAGLTDLPDWSATFEISGWSLGMSPASLEATLGPPTRRIEEDLSVYPGGLVVRTREGRIVNLSAADQVGGAWSLLQGEGGRGLAGTGGAASELRGRFGVPHLRYVRPGGLQAWVYQGRQEDVGFMVLDGRVVGLLLAEAGMLPPGLADSGYVLMGEEGETP